MNTPDAIEVSEVGRRDGLQSLAPGLPTQRELDWIHALRITGWRKTMAAE